MGLERTDLHPWDSPGSSREVHICTELAAQDIPGERCRRARGEDPLNPCAGGAAARLGRQVAGPEGLQLIKANRYNGVSSDKKSWYTDFGDCCSTIL